MTQKPNPNPFGTPPRPPSGSRPTGIPAQQPSRPAPPASGSRFGSGLSSRFGPARTTWEILPVRPQIVRFSLDGMGGSLQRLTGTSVQSQSGSFEALIHAIEKNREGLRALLDSLNSAWNSYSLKGAMLVYPWDEERKPVLLAHARISGIPATCLRALDPILVLNVLGRARVNFVQPRAPISLDPSYLERSLMSDDPRLVKLTQQTGYIEETIPEEAKLDEEAEE